MGGCVSAQKRNDPGPYQPGPSAGMPGGQPGGSGTALMSQALINRYDGTPKMYHVNSASGMGGQMLDSPRLDRQQSNPQTPAKQQLIALYNYESKSEGDLSFEKGEVMLLIDGR